jgi:hypothetical protein
VYLDVGGLIKTVHLVQQLEQDSLNFSISSGLSVESLGCNGVDFINENDSWRVLLGQSEYVTHHARSFAQILLHKLRSNHSDEGS